MTNQTANREQQTVSETAKAAGLGAYWRAQFGVGDRGNLESTASASMNPQDPKDRIAQARETMVRIVKERFGGDVALIEQIESLELSAAEAVAILEQGSIEVPTPDQLAALEAVVVFDGTRPSFLIKNDAVDFASSYNTGPWQDGLALSLDALAARAACVGRVELGHVYQGTAFLVTPTLAITNRHVAQTIAAFSNGRIRVTDQWMLDFGREAAGGRQTYDARRIRGVEFAGPDTVAAPIDHDKLDLAVLRVSESTLPDDRAHRCLAVGATSWPDLVQDASFIATIGYPVNPEGRVPDDVWNEFGGVIRKLLEGDGGAKRLAPGQPMTSVRDSLTEATATHDATTINGNSGSPLFAFPSDAPPRAAGLHYGGRSKGDRVNWAHLLHHIGARQGYGTDQTFAEFCAREGIDWR